ncbi:MAG: MFS transporter [Acetobacteraceae bacterium]|nr:MFS transporter [Acetobacteraceae bacterium]
MRHIISNRHFLQVWAGQVISNVGDWFTYVALIARIYQMGGGSLAVSGLLISQMGSALLAGQVAGVLVDRLNRKQTMIAVDLVRAAVIFAAVFSHNLWVIYALVFVAGVGSALFQPALYASVPNLVKPESLAMANSLITTTYNLGFVMGPALGGIITGRWGAGVALLGDAISFLVSAACVALSKVPQEARARGPLNLRAAYDDLVEGLRHIRQRTEVLVVIVTLLAIMSFSGLINVVEIYFARDVLHAGNQGFGYMVSAWGAGMVLGSLLPGLIRAQSRAMALFLAAVLLQGVGVGLVGVAPHLVWALAFLVVGGLGNGAHNVAAAVVIQQATADQLRGRVFSTRRTLAYLGWVVSMAVGGFLPSIMPLRAIYIMTGLSHLLILGAAVGLMQRAGQVQQAEAARPGPGKAGRE